MDCTDSFSMTPPLSPRGFDLLLEAPLPVQDRTNHGPVLAASDQVSSEGTIFLCQGEDRFGCHDNMHPHGPLKTGCLERMKDGQRTEGDQCVDCDLYGYNFTRQTALRDNMLQLFQFTRQWVGQIENFPAGSMSKDQSEELQQKRKQLKQFMDYSIIFLRQYVEPDESADLIQELIHHLHHLLVYLGRLRDHPYSPGRTSLGFKSRGDKSHMFHTHLDLYWGMLQVVAAIKELTPGVCSRSLVEPCAEADVWTQLLQHILWDLVLVCSHRFHNLSCSDRWSVSPFPCVCVKEMLILIIHVSSWGQDTGAGQSFWCSFQSIVEGLLTGSNSHTETDMMEINDSMLFSNPPEIQVGDRPGLCLWLLTNVAPLLAYNERGMYRPQEALSSCYPLLTVLLKKCLSSPVRDESQLQYTLQCCVRLSALWEPHVNLLMILWDYYCGKLNNDFHIALLSIEGLASIRKSALSFLAECKRFTQSIPVTNKPNVENSYCLFLRLLSQHLQRESLQGWRQMKGRIFSRFHQRRMQELRETGLDNLTKLFITLVLVVQTDTDTVAGKLCDLYDMLDFNSLDMKRRGVVWKGAFSLMAIYIEKRMDISFLAEKMARSFNACCSEFCERHMDTMNKQKLWSLLSFYLENMADMIEGSQEFNLSQHKIIGEGMLQILPVCRENESQTILTTALTILTKIRSAYTEIQDKPLQFTGAKALVDALWGAVYPFVKQHATTQTPPAELADVAASFCLSAAEFGEDPQSVCAVCQYFTLREDVNIRFLNHVLQSDTFMAAIDSGIPDPLTFLIQSWLRCTLLIPSTSEELQTLSRIVLKLPEVKAVFDQAEMSVPSSLEVGLLLFFKAMGRCNQKAQSLAERIQYRNKTCAYCCDLIRYLTPVLRNHGPPETLSCVYRVTGHLIKHCAPLLYVKSQPDCPLPAVIERLVLPHSLFDPKKTLHPNLLLVMREYLHLFIQGLSLLDYKRDPFVQRRLKDIVVQFLQRIPIKASNNQGFGSTQSVHPLVACLGKSRSMTPEEVEDSHFRSTVLTLVRDHFMHVTAMTIPPNAVMGLSYMTEVFRRTMVVGQIAKDAVILLEVMLEFSLLADTPVLKQQVCNILQVLIEACVKTNRTESLTSLVPSIQRFLSRYLKLQPVKVLEEVLDRLAILHPGLLTHVISSLTISILAMERKRGVGTDAALRKSYFQVLKKLGQHGEDEMNKLNLDRMHVFSKWARSSADLGNSASSELSSADEQMREDSDIEDRERDPSVDDALLRASSTQKLPGGP